MPNNRSNHFNAILLALFVTFLWSTSWVLIKIGLEEIPPVTFAGLRYFIAFLVLLPFSLRPKQINEIKHITPKTWLLLIGLGITFYALTQGAQFGSLKYLSATTFSLILSFTSVIVVFLGIAFLNEIPAKGQWVGMCLFLIGVGFYFAESSAFQGEAIGWIIAAAAVAANAVSSILGRRVNREKNLSPILVTTISMGVGAILLLAGGFIYQGWVALSTKSWLIVIWLAVVNSALAFTLWNKSLRSLTAMESSVINNTMLFQIAILAWVFLGEALAWFQVVGIIIAGFGTFLVQKKEQPSQSDR